MNHPILFNWHYISGVMASQKKVARFTDLSIGVFKEQITPFIGETVTIFYLPNDSRTLFSQEELILRIDFMLARVNMQRYSDKVMERYLKINPAQQFKVGEYHFGFDGRVEFIPLTYQDPVKGKTLFPPLTANEIMQHPHLQNNLNHERITLLSWH